MSFVLGLCAVCSCMQGTFKWPFVNSTELRCDTCLSGAHCEANATLADVHVLPRHWRLSARSHVISVCREGSSGLSACAGGQSADHEGEGYCERGHYGPLCEVCVNSSQYFNKEIAHCIDCPVAAETAGWSGAIIGGTGLVLVITWLVFRKYRSSALALVRRFVIKPAATMALMPKLKLLISFYGMVSALPTVYNVQLPSQYYEWMGFLDFLELDWSHLMIPGQCLPGGFVERLFLRGLGPLVFVLAVFLLCAVAAPVLRCFKHDRRAHVGEKKASIRKAHTHVLTQSLLDALPYVLFVCFCICASTASSVFATWSCAEYEEDSTVEPVTTRSFLRSDPSVECNTDEWQVAANAALFFVFLWAVAMPLMFLGVLKGENNN